MARYFSGGWPGKTLYQVTPCAAAAFWNPASSAGCRWGRVPVQEAALRVGGGETVQVRIADVPAH